MKLTTTTINRINELHQELMGVAISALEKAIEIGGLLGEIKESLPHGAFTNWINDNCNFSDRTARNYLKAYNNRDKLKTESVSDLTTAYKLLEEKKEPKQEKTFPSPESFEKWPDLLYGPAVYLYEKGNSTSEIAEILKYDEEKIKKAISPDLEPPALKVHPEDRDELSDMLYKFYKHEYLYSIYWHMADIYRRAQFYAEGEKELLNDLKTLEKHYNKKYMQLGESYSKFPYFKDTTKKWERMYNNFFLSTHLLANEHFRDSIGIKDCKKGSFFWSVAEKGFGINNNPDFKNDNFKYN